MSSTAPARRPLNTHHAVTLYVAVSVFSTPPLREGQKVRVKLEAFPFTDYGLVEGIVETISRDAVQQEAQPGGEGSKAQPGGLMYTARIKLSRSWIQVGGRRQPIGPGLAVQAEIKTGQRRIIQYLVSPISKAMDEAGRER